MKEMTDWELALCSVSLEVTGSEETHRCAVFLRKPGVPQIGDGLSLTFILVSPWMPQL